MPDQREAFVTELHHQYEAAMLKSCYRYVHYDSRLMDLAEDCVQESFLLLFQRYEEVKEHPFIGRWLMTVCLHKLDNALYKRHIRDRRTAFSIDEYPETPPEPLKDGLERWLEAQAAIESIQRIRQVLSQRENDLFDDYFLLGLTAKEIAYKRQTTVGGVKSMLRKIRQKAKNNRLDGFLLALGILSHFH